MCRLVETIKIFKREPLNLGYHDLRLNYSRKMLFGQEHKIKLSDHIKIPEYLKEDIYKCRVIFYENIHSIEFLPYILKEIRTLKLVKSKTINYVHKFLNRQQIEELYQQRNDCDDIIIIKNGQLTDTSFCNIALFDGSEWFTPEIPLLKGTKRQKLLDEKIIFSKEIRVEDLNNYQKICVFNAMIEFGEIVIPVENIRL